MARVNPWVRDAIAFVWPILLLWILSALAGVLVGLALGGRLWRA